MWQTIFRGQFNRHGWKTSSIYMLCRLVVISSICMKITVIVRGLFSECIICTKLNCAWCKDYCNQIDFFLVLRTHGQMSRRHGEWKKWRHSVILVMNEKKREILCLWANCVDNCREFRGGAKCESAFFWCC